MEKIFTRFLHLMTAALILSSSVLIAQAAPTPLENCSYKNATSYESMLSYLEDLKKNYPFLEVETIGTSVQGRKIPMIHVVQKDSGKKVKVVLFCQQHGNEPSGKEAALLILKKIADEKGAGLYPNLDLYIIPSVNPDGNEAGKRNNGSGEDLNRDHLLLSQPEVAALHKIFMRIKPEVTLDVHEYSAYRKEFRDAGYFRRADEQFGAPTNLNVSEKIVDYSLNKLFPFLDSELKKRGVIFSNYYKMNGPADTVRASTTSIDDGRQSFAILNTFSFILEGKNGRNMNDELQRRTTSQIAAIESFLSFVNINSVEIKELVKREKNQIAKSAEPVVLQMDYVFNGSKINLEMETVSGKDTSVAMYYSPEVKSLESVDRPDAYVVPGSRKDIIDLLDRHGIHYRTIQKEEDRQVEIYTVKSVAGKWMENKPTKYLSVTKRISKSTISRGDVIVPLDDYNSLLLVIALEPTSMWGLVQYDEFSYLREKGKDYPIYRIPVSKRN